MIADGLLTIDVEAEIRRLAEATLEGPWQVPAELVRRAVAAGARSVELELGRRRLRVRDDGTPVAAAAARALEVLLDGRASGTERHRALVTVEPVPGLVSLLAVRGARVRVQSGHRAGTLVQIEGTALDTGAARRWLARACRFCPARVVVDGVALPTGFEDALAEATLAPPLTGRLAIPRGGEAAQVVLLHHGVVSAHLTLPEAPAFEAAVETARLVESRTPAAQREAVAPYVASLVDQSVGLLLRLGERLGALSEAEARFVRGQLLGAARRRLRRAEVFRLPLLPAVAPEGGRRLVGLLDVGRDRTLWCLDPGEDAAAFRLPERMVFVLDAEERGRIAQLLGLSFKRCEPRHAAGTLATRLRRAVRALREGLGRAALRLRHPRLGRSLPDSALGPDEAALLTALRGALGTTEIRFTDGAGPARRLGASAWRLPRHDAFVAAAVRAVARDPSWAYPAALALFQGWLVPSSSALDAWRRRTA